ncbi:hypothetical protein B9Z55_020654 [Caenorhabditis nigoni]|uniref:T20D4.11-like domain-containing protein n=1 Tax=Caenorhabditis nigoni TaxID=1611254 RepID=A0A2G5TNL4_9PELO|nr:hypothetical protein B9Z55_020654 [Caenorhabditis nigoni]
MLLHFLLFSCFIGVALSSETPSQIPECTIEEKRNLLTCNPMELDILNIRKKYSNRRANPEFLSEMHFACFAALNCYKPPRCREASSYQAALDEACDFHILMFPQNADCLMKFFSAAYNASSAAYKDFSTYSCLQYPFTESDSARRSSVFGNGRSCFLEFVKNNCNWSSELYFSTRYRQFVNAISEEPDNNNCLTEYQQMKHMRCHVLLAETEKKIENTGFFDRLFGSRQFLAAVKACKDTRACIARDVCFSATIIPTKIGQICKKIGL